jgi:hypothetical protein
MADSSQFQDYGWATLKEAVVTIVFWRRSATASSRSVVKIGDNTMAKEGRFDGCAGNKNKAHIGQKVRAKQTKRLLDVDYLMQYTWVSFHDAHTYVRLQV